VSPASPLRTAALQLLGRRDYTAAELRERLIERDFPADDVAALLTALAADGLIDDRRVAAAHVRTAGRVKGRGRLRIVRELEARGIDRATAREAVADLTPEVEADAIKRIVERKAGGRHLSRDARRRLVQHLMRRGFSASAITAALESFGGQDDD
jgi:regulatory protein